MLLGDPLGTRVPGDAGLRRLASEYGGPRPAGVRSAEASGAMVATRVAIARKP